MTRRIPIKTPFPSQSRIAKKLGLSKTEIKSVKDLLGPIEVGQASALRRYRKKRRTKSIVKAADLLGVKN
jgi:hypothetical protein